MNFKKYITLIVAMATFGSLALAVPVFAENAGQPPAGRGNGRGIMMGRGLKNGLGIFGTVGSITGETLTITTKAKPNANGAAATSVIYTVDATNATVTKNGTTGAVGNLSGVAVGDTIVVQGTVNGTNVVAKKIRDGAPGQGQKGMMPIIQGNGQPVVAGKVSAISGNTITISNASNVTYSIDATNSKFVVAGVATPAISNVAVGDSVVAQGTVNGTNVVATTVIDQKPRPANATETENDNSKPQGFMGGMMGGIGNFFKHMFGF